MTITGRAVSGGHEYLEHGCIAAAFPGADLIDIRAGKEAMPERPVMITDDGYRPITILYLILGVKPA